MGLGWLCQMVRACFAGWAGVALPDVPDWICWMGGVVFARWAGLTVPNGLSFFAGQAGLA